MINPNAVEVEIHTKTWCDLKIFPKSLEDFKENDYKRVINACTKLIKEAKLTPGSAPFYFFRGYCHLKTKSNEDVLESYKNALKDINNFFKISMKSEIKAIHYGIRGECYSLIRECYEIKPDNYNFELDYFIIDELNPDNDDEDSYTIAINSDNLAICDYEMAIELEADNHAYYAERGYVYYNRGQYNLAAADFDKSSLKKCNDFKVIFYLSLCYFHLTKYSLSDEMLEKSLRLMPRNIENKYLYFFSSLYADKGMYKQAEYLCNKVSVYSWGEIKHKATQLSFIQKAQELDTKNKEIEEIMSMFSHEFRSPLDTIIYNTEHENNPKLYKESAQIMRGLLDLYSIISTDDSTLNKTIEKDSDGNGRLIFLFEKMLNMVLVHLLSTQGTKKIHQHYMAYAVNNNNICDSISYKEWHDDYYDLELKLREEWDQSFSKLLSALSPLKQCLTRRNYSAIGH